MEAANLPEQVEVLAQKIKELEWLQKYTPTLFDQIVTTLKKRKNWEIIALISASLFFDEIVTTLKKRQTWEAIAVISAAFALRNLR